MDFSELVGWGLNIRSEEILDKSLKHEVGAKQECIPVGCVPAAHSPCAKLCFPAGGCLPQCILGSLTGAETLPGAGTPQEQTPFTVA